jgi:hypothetical protein
VFNIPNYAPDLSGYVPYTGATGAVNLGPYDLTVNGVLVGKGAGTGGESVILGYEALRLNTTGYRNVAIGARPLWNNTTGVGNVAIGAETLISAISGNINIAIGDNTAKYITTGSYNTVIGPGSGLNGLTTGSYNTIIGGSIASFGDVSNNIVLADGQGNIKYKWDGTNNNFYGNAIFSGNITASTIVKSGGTSSQFLKADGSVDSTAYVSGSGIAGRYAIWDSSGVLSDGCISAFNNITYVECLGLNTQNGLEIEGNFGGGSGGLKIKSYDETTGKAFMEFINTSGVFRLGIEGSTGGGILPGSTAYATVLTSGLTAKNLEFGTNNTKRMTIDGTSGGVGIGTDSLTGYNLRISKNLTGSTSVYNIASFGTIQSDATSSASYFETSAATQATAFTIGSLRHFYANQSTIGAGSVVTSQYGFLAGATLVGATNNYGFYGNIPSGSGRWNVYMGGTANNYMAGSLGIGAVSLTGYSLKVSKVIAGAASAYGIVSDGTIQSDVIGTAIYNATYAQTQASSFTLPVIYHYYANQGNFGAGSTVTNQHGFFVSSNLTGATNNYGFRGEIAAGTGRWNLYMSGTANNHLAGNLLIGSTEDNGSKLQVTGAATFSSSVTAGGRILATASGNDTFGFQMYKSGTTTTLAGFYQNSTGDGLIAAYNSAGVQTIQLTTNGTSYLNGGNVGIGTTAPSHKLQVAGSSGTIMSLSNGADADLLMNFTSGVTLLTPTTGILAFGTSSTERMRITSGGNVLVALTGTSAYLDGKFSSYGSGTTPAACFKNDGNGQFTASFWNAGATGGTQTILSFVWGSSPSVVGSITSGGSSVSYNTTSDYRLKEDLKPINGLEIVNRIKVYDYKWKAEDSRMDGVLAHELAEVLPYAVSGVKDGEQMQGVDYSKIVPVAIKAIQETDSKVVQLEKKIVILEAEIQTLKNK